MGENADGVKTEFHLHEHAVVRLSDPLRNLMQGGRTESQAGCTKWDDVSKDTFERFAQFAYTGDYSIPKKDEKKVSESNKPSSSTLVGSSNEIVNMQNPSSLPESPLPEPVDQWMEWSLP